MVYDPLKFGYKKGKLIDIANVAKFFYIPLNVIQLKRLQI